MKLDIEGLHFEGEYADFLQLAVFSEVVRKLVKADNGVISDLGGGQSYTLESNQTWDDDVDPGS